MSKIDTDNKLSNVNDFAGKAGIELVSPSLYEEAIEINATSQKVICAVGPSGVGKTAMPIQIAKRRNGGNGVPYAAVYMPTATPESWWIPSLAADNKNYFDQRIPRTFQTILDWAKKMEDRYGEGNVPADMCPILAIEELNRATDKAVTRAAFVVIGDRMIGDTKIPGCVQIVATMNPTGGGMAVNEFEKDPAMRRRLVQIGVGHNHNDFIAYAKKAKMHQDVIDHLNAHPSHGYDTQAALAGKSFACPATWETVSKMCYLLEQKNVKLYSPLGRAMITGAIGTGAATAFLEFVRDRVKFLTPDDILAGYGPDTESRKRFMAYLQGEDGMRTDLIDALCGGGEGDKITGVAASVYADLQRDPETYAASLGNFMADLPAENAQKLLKALHAASNTGREGVEAYGRAFNRAMARQPGFKAALQKVQTAKSRAEQEAKGA